MARIFMSAVVALALVVGAAGEDAVTSACTVANRESCKCLLSSDVFGSDPKPCEDPVDENIANATISRAHRFPQGRECEAMQTVVSCASQLGCMDKQVTQLCGQVVNKLNMFQKGSCEIECSGGHRALAGAPALLAAAVALLLLAPQ
ncbi:unnamed protein product [Prorocentrum cordatum]|uniref:Uncharacterized protein n=1 Tax=Prorocentrum cordatum TaxID=2364126 RepID=A0ABN9WVI9_9DINO|nr:unnamed protein product [Polarella glacialis]|mmetsp:Transcript_30115/g.78856  ORF Transcript_30115/g.78856 Transcript_30115/m.78856 type:complete len:147 (-) Transcript_30115:193-633(-)